MPLTFYDAAIILRWLFLYDFRRYACYFRHAYTPDFASMLLPAMPTPLIAVDSCRHMLRRSLMPCVLSGAHMIRHIYLRLFRD